LEATHNALFISTFLKHMSWPDSCKPAGMDNQAKPMIMVVDDDADMLMVMTATLERQGYRVDARATPPNWIELQAVHPDVLFLDVELASSNGVLVCKSINENLLNWNLPVVLTSGHGEYQLEKEAFYCHADGFISKPFNGRDLKQVVEHFTQVGSPLEKGTVDRPGRGVGLALQE